MNLFIPASYCLGGSRVLHEASALHERTTPGTGKVNYSGTKSKQPPDGSRLLVTTGCVGRAGFPGASSASVDACRSGDHRRNRHLACSTLYCGVSPLLKYKEKPQGFNHPHPSSFL
ncbi:MAG: hypothetical protein WEB89_09440 [Balneolales bacterium]